MYGKNRPQLILNSAVFDRLGALAINKGGLKFLSRKREHPHEFALVTSFAFATYAGSAIAQSTVPAPPGTGAVRPMLTLRMPPIPDPVPVTLKPASTAVLVFDIVDPICTSQPKCLNPWYPQSVRF